MNAQQQDARVAAVAALRVRANQVMLGRRTHIEIDHLDALRIVDLMRELTEDRDRLRRAATELWERMDLLEAHIGRLGSSVDAALAGPASVTLTEGGDAKQAPGASLSGAVGEAETPKGGSHA